MGLQISGRKFMQSLYQVFYTIRENQFAAYGIQFVACKKNVSTLRYASSDENADEKKALLALVLLVKFYIM